LTLREPGRSQGLLAGGLAAAFALSAVTDPVVLGASAALSLVIFHRGAWRALRRLAVVVLPPVLLLTLGSWAWLRLLGAGPLPARPFAAMALRTLVIAFVTFSVLARADLLRALAPFPLLSRLLVVSLAQVHALRRVATESREGLRSRMARRPGTREAVRNAGGVTATLLTLSTRNARDAADAMRSRGF
jgi:cobalt/nickel transport system permease protein